MLSGAILALFFNIIFIQKLWPSFHNIYNVCNVELSLWKKKKKKNWKTYFCRKKRTAVFPFKKRTKYSKNVLVGSSGLQTTTFHLFLTMGKNSTKALLDSTKEWYNSLIVLMESSFCTLYTEVSFGVEFPFNWSHSYVEFRISLKFSFQYGKALFFSSWMWYYPKSLKHKDSFGKSENLSKIFFAEILVFDHDYEGKSSSSNGLLWISFFFLFFIIYLNYFSNCLEGLRTNLYMCTRYQLYFARCNYFYYQIVNLTSVQSVKVVQKYFG